MDPGVVGFQGFLLLEVAHVIKGLVQAQSSTVFLGQAIWNKAGSREQPKRCELRVVWLWKRGWRGLLHLSAKPGTGMCIDCTLHAKKGVCKTDNRYQLSTAYGPNLTIYMQQHASKCCKDWLGARCGNMVPPRTSRCSFGHIITFRNGFLLKSAEHCAACSNASLCCYRISETLGECFGSRIPDTIPTRLILRWMASSFGHLGWRCCSHGGMGCNP